ncbi:hypothetical protein R1flu_017079 [Riccia fluitans]|uniref:Uncharacterized protein n=1 Tax=Riccia fluitans TaxID=41844 RepID=A0ABD1YP81_9MARC
MPERECFASIRKCPARHLEIGTPWRAFPQCPRGCSDGNAFEGVIKMPLRTFREGSGRAIVQSGNAPEGIIETPLRAFREGGGKTTLVR